VLEGGREAGSPRLPGPAKEEARAIVDGLEGALLVARPLGDAERFEATAARLLARLGARAEA